MYDFFGETKKRISVGKQEWDVIKQSHGNKCVICKRTDRQVGGLVRAHIKAHSRGGTQVLPMCSICHKKFDRDQLTATELKRVGLTKRSSSRLSPKKKKTTKGPFDIF